MNKTLRWIKANSTLLMNAGSLISTTLVTSGFGFIYWWVAARYFSTDVVGIASASISTMTLLGTLGIVGMGTLLITEIPRQPQKAVSLISTGLLTVAVVGGCGGLLFALIAPILSNQFSPLHSSVLNVITFAAGVSLTSITLVLDQALIGLLHGILQFVRNTVFSGGKLVVLFLMGILLSHATGMSIYATWALGNLLSLAVIVPILLRRRRPLKTYLPQWKLLRQLGSAALQHHMLNIALQLPAYALPTVVTILLSAKMNALFYVSWMIVNFVFYIPAALTVVLHAMNSAHQSTLADRARVTIGLALVTNAAAIIVLELITQFLLRLFGSSYVQATQDLRILALAAFAIIIKNHYISICRIQDRVRNAMVVIVPGAFVELGLAVLGSHFDGLLGLSAGWVIAVYIEAAFMFPTVFGAVWAKKASQLVTEGLHDELEAIWLADTLLLPAINTSMSLNITTSKLPAVRPAYKKIVLERSAPPRYQTYSQSRSGSLSHMKPFAQSSDSDNSWFPNQVGANTSSVEQHSERPLS